MELANILCLRLFDQIFEEYDWVEVERATFLEPVPEDETKHALEYRTDLVCVNGETYHNPLIRVQRINTDDHVAVRMFSLEDKEVFSGVYKLPVGVFEKVR